ncbi:MAG: hypothetical protein LBB26_03855 [Puniceicoccales bacterium]|nr:hypothetical protein [Puniceicoccales bacterium]
MSESKKADEPERLESRRQKSITLHRESHLGVGYSDAKGYVGAFDLILRDIMSLAKKCLGTPKNFMLCLVGVPMGFFKKAHNNGFSNL